MDLKQAISLFPIMSIWASLKAATAVVSGRLAAPKLDFYI